MREKLHCVSWASEKYIWPSTIFPAQAQLASTKLLKFHPCVHHDLTCYFCCSSCQRLSCPVWKWGLPWQALSWGSWRVSPNSQTLSGGHPCASPVSASSSSLSSPSSSWVWRWGPGTVRPAAHAQLSTEENGIRNMRFN